MNASNPQKKRNTLLSWLFNLAGLLIFGLILYLGGVETWQQIVHGDWRYVLAAFAVTLLWNLVAALRWMSIANHALDEPIDCPFRYYFTYQMIGMFVGQVVPITVGMLGGRPVALSLSKGVPLKRAALSVFLDKFFDLLLALLLAVPVVLFLIDWIGLQVALGLMAAIAIGTAVLVRWQFERGIQLFGQMASLLVKPLSHVPVIGTRLARRLPDQLDRLSSSTMLPNRLAAQAYLLTLTLYGLLSVRLYFIAQALHLNIPWYLLAMGVCVTQLTIIFAVTPGAMGFLEGGWAAVFGLGGLSMEQFTIFVIGRRAFVLVFTLIDTLLAFAWIRESPARLFRDVLSTSRKPETADAESGADPVLTASEDLSVSALGADDDTDISP